MPKPSLIVLGGTGLIGSAVCDRFTHEGHEVVVVDSKNCARLAGATADILINCNGNSYRYKAAEDPRWDFDATVLTVEKSLFEFKFTRYIHLSTIDVYPELADPMRNHEESSINPLKLHPYGFHKWMAERLVERFAERALILRVGTVVGPGVKKGPLFDLLHGEPLHMSANSELSLIDTQTVAEALVRFVGSPPQHSIINLTGTGPAPLRQLCNESGIKWRAAEGAEGITYHYNVNNARFRELYPVAASLEIGRQFLKRALEQGS